MNHVHMILVSVKAAYSIISPNILIMMMVITEIANKLFALVTLHQKRKRVGFEFPEEIPLGYEYMMQMLLENAKIKIFYRGTLTLVYIYTKN